MISTNPISPTAELLTYERFIPFYDELTRINPGVKFQCYRGDYIPNDPHEILKSALTPNDLGNMDFTILLPRGGISTLKLPHQNEWQAPNFASRVCERDSGYQTVSLRINTTFGTDVGTVLFIEFLEE